MKKILLQALTLCLGWSAIAQKLPKVQEAGLRAPANIKIDGKATEWDKFAAYNATTGTFYTLSNDGERVYLVVQVKDFEIINKILGGGLTLTVQKSTDKKDKDKITITYPITDSKTALAFNVSAMKMNPNNPGTLMADTTAKAADSLMEVHNKILIQKCKLIGVRGIEGIDTTISVYNEDGIKAAGLFDRKATYTLEMSVPLKHLKLTVDTADKFNYNIRINGLKRTDELFGTFSGSAAALARITQQLDERNARQASATDFWGEYVLVKK